MSVEKCVYAHVKEYPITARIGTGKELLELRDKAMALDPELIVNYAESDYWFLKPGIRWTEILPGSTLAHLLEKLEREYPQNGSIRVLRTSTNVAFFVTGSVPGYHYVCTKAELIKFYDNIPPGTIELDPLGDGICSIDIRRVMEGYPDHPVVKEFVSCYALAELSDNSARSNNHIMHFEFL